MIDQKTIERILSTADIVDVISQFVTLRKAGVNFKGLCPFHNEKTPSFVVSPSKGICKCFSCGKGGNVVHFIMLHEQMSYPEALRWLADKYHIEIEDRELTPEELQMKNERESLFIVNEWASKYFQDNLYNNSEGQSIGMNYFRSRGFRDDTIQKFQLGYCLSSPDSMAKAALKAGYREDYIIKTGLCFKRDDGQLRDKYHGRVIFPVHTLSGKVVAFGGRVLNTSEKTAKYINSPESEIYHKSNELYGIYLAKQSIVKHDRCFLVEGYTDVISMHQSGIENVVASSGTSLTEGQIRLIHRFTNNITILYDGDMAGIKASLRGINMLLEEGLNIKVLLLPDNDDPDSFARKHNAAEYTDYIDSHQIDFIHFKVNLLLEDCKDDPIKKAQLVGNIIESIAVIPDALIRSIYTKECSSLLNVKEEVLVNETVKQRARHYREKAKQREIQQMREQAAREQGTAPEESSQSPATPVIAVESIRNEEETMRHKQETQLIRMIIRHGEKVMGNYLGEDNQPHPVKVIDYIGLDMDADSIVFEDDLYRQIMEEARQHIAEKDFIASRHFMGHPEAAISALAAQMMSDRYQLSDSFAKDRNISSEESRLKDIIPQLMINLKLSIVNAEIKKVMSVLKSPDLLSDKNLYLQQLEKYKALKDLEKELTRLGGESAITTY